MPESKEEIVGLFARAAPTHDAAGPRHFTYFERKLVEQSWLAGMTSLLRAQSWAPRTTCKRSRGRMP